MTDEQKRIMTPDHLTDKYINPGNSKLKDSQPLTIANLLDVLQFLDMRVRHNMQLGEDEITCETWPDSTPEDLMVVLKSTLKMVWIKAQGDLAEFLTVIAARDQYHPMEEWLKSLPLPKKDPMKKLLRSVETDGDLMGEVFPVWLSQCVEAVCGWRGDYDPTRTLSLCLVLQGAQGVGKTQFFSNLGQGFLKTEGDIQLGSHFNAEDSQIRALKWPMVELAELDGITNRKEQSELKAFLSGAVDTLRPKYGRKAINRPRMTSFCGTVNIGQFITDQTGSRRFLPVHVKSIDWEADINYEGLWAHAYARWQQNGHVELTEAQAAMVKDASEEFVQLVPEAQLIIGHYHEVVKEHKRNPNTPGSFAAFNQTEICRYLRIQTSFQAGAAVARHMTAVFGRSGTVDGKQNAWLFPVYGHEENITLVSEKIAKAWILRRKIDPENAPMVRN